MGDILEEVIFCSVEKSEKNSVVRYSHFYHPLANSEDISRMTGTLEVVFWLTQERKVLACFKRVLQGDYSTCQHLEMVQLDVSILLHIPKTLLASQTSRWRCCSSSWDISAAWPGRRGAELPLGSFFCRIWQKFGKTHCKITLNSEKFCQKSECSGGSDWQDRCEQPRGAIQRLARGPRTSS